jgi:metal-responsive CopG/Arc/MetJ family transcriptional regulator
MQYMKQVLVELEDDVAAKLEKVAPARSRGRSEFIRRAIRRALWDLEEKETAEAYRRRPDSSGDAYLDPAVWETRPKKERKR